MADATLADQDAALAAALLQAQQKNQATLVPALLDTQIGGG